VATAALGAGGSLVGARQAIDRIERVPGVAEVLSPQNGPVENYLLVGSDTRAGADPNSPDAGGIGTEADVDGTARSDTLMVLRRDTANGALSLLSIPRDLYVDIVGRDSPNRINAAYRDGPATLVQTVQTALGIPVHHYVEVNFNGFKTLVDALGGVEICFLEPARDTHTGLYIAQPGCQVLDGVQALAFARSRFFEKFVNGDWERDGSSDIGRMKRQQLFVNEALGATLDAVKSDPLVTGDLLAAVSSAIVIDDELDPLSAAAALRSAVGGGLATYSMPVEGATIDGNSVLLLADRADQLLAYFRGDGPAPTAER
jgi:LCP family protein required for cell wall assembly